MSTWDFVMSSDLGSSRRGSNACSQSSLSSNGSSLTATRDLWRLRQTMHCLEKCPFYHGSLNRNKAREKMRRCRPVSVIIYNFNIYINFKIHAGGWSSRNYTIKFFWLYGNFSEWKFNFSSFFNLSNNLDLNAGGWSLCRSFRFNLKKIFGRELQAQTSKSGHAIFFSFFRRVRATSMTQRRVENTGVHFWTFLPVSFKMANSV